MVFMVASILFFFVCLYPFLSQPFSLGVILFFVTMLMKILFSELISSWVGMLLFLIYVGGVLVMFVFVISFLPNISFPFMSFFFCFSGVVSGMFLMGEDMKSELILSGFESFKFSFFFLEGVSVSLYMGLIMVLFMILVAVSVLCFSQKNSMRGYQNYV
uniref:NADH dehydrogenase subunit 6 n=1 Tax=Chaetoderma nitidulum TaxID=256131 RepID=D3G6D4_CHANT|nr:NADH dehydrogenase subunit 6 [Chaetoderma nitidulum]ABM69282.1 NADH dehydrogenase subunit 6 [Chaetoderma nitidulum]